MQHPILHFEQADNFVLAYYAGGETAPKGVPFSEEPEIEPEPGAWAALDQRGQTVHGSQTNLTGDADLSGEFQGPVSVGGDAVDLAGSQGAIYKPSGPVEQYLGHTEVTRISDVSGQVIVGDGNVQAETIGAPGTFDAPAKDASVLNAILAELQSTVASGAPPEKRDAALERLGEFSEALATQPPDLATLEYVQGWFARQIPDLGGALSAILAHPVVVRWIESSGDDMAAEFRRRFSP
jgi:hypothetical protein